MSLFRLGDFTLHSGTRSSFKIDCDALTDGDWAALAVMLKERLPPFGPVVGVARGGLKLAAALAAHSSKRCPTVLVCDDVLTTGGSMGEVRARVLSSVSTAVVGAVVFARGPCPDWVTPLFQMTSPHRTCVAREDRR
jgi:orotate phosphoribosyltransferase